VYFPNRPDTHVLETCSPGESQFLLIGSGRRPWRRLLRAARPLFHPL